MRLFLKTTAIDYVLCVAVASALTFTVASGFYATQPFQDAYGILLIVGLNALLMAALFVIVRSMRSMAIGIPILVLAIAGILVACYSTSSIDAPLDDVAGNTLLFALCVICCCIGCFLLSRTRVGAAILLVGGVSLCALIEYLYWYHHIAAALVFFIGAAVLFAYRVYQHSVLDSDSERFAFGAVSLAAVALVGVSVAIGFGVYTFVIAPLDPPSFTVKLITERYRADELEVRGIAETAEDPDDTQSNEQDDDIVQSSDLGEFDNAEAASGNAPKISLNSFQEDAVEGFGNGLAGLSLFFKSWVWLIALIVVVALIAFLVLLKKYLRSRRLKRAMSKGADGAVGDLYLFFLNRFNRLKVPQPDSLTLSEYVKGFSETFNTFERRCEGPTFADLTAIYTNQVYGGNPASDEDAARFAEYYRLFFKRACGYLGRWRYVWKFFRL